MSRARRRQNTELKLLRIYAQKMARKAGVSTQQRLSAIVSDLAGSQMGKADAYRWLASHRAKYVPGAPEMFQGPVVVMAKVDRQQRRLERKAASDAFYNSKEWRAVRFVALKRADGCCTLCGRSKRDHGVVLHVDHIKPRSLFPKFALDAANLQVLCEDCNLGKSNRDQTDWRPSNVIELARAS